jgi:MSHA pilin protein MshD
MTCCPRSSRRGFTIVEAALSTVVVGVMLVAALQTVGAARIAQCRNADRVRGAELASDLMAEITAQAYEDPALPTGSFGLALSKAAGGTRSKFNDVDDYDGWTESPPQQKSGAVIPGFTGWTRAVRVRWVVPANPSATSLTDTGAKLITVTVSRNGVTVMRLSSIRSAGR